MSFTPPVVGCLLKKGLQGWGSQVPQGPLATPLLFFETFSPLSRTLQFNQKGPTQKRLPC